MKKLYKADHKQRDLILKGFFDEKDYFGGTRRFSKLPLQLLELLVAENHADEEDYQNNAPTIRDLITFAKQMKDKGFEFQFHGYAISPDRDDYRISIDGISIKYYFDNYNYINIKAIKNFFKNADEKNEDEGYLYFWYD
jgi:hypothetical protein